MSKINIVFTAVILSFIIALTSFSINKSDILRPENTVILIANKPDYLEVEGATRISKWLKRIYNTDKGFDVLRDSLLNDAGDKIVISIGNTRFTSRSDIRNLPPYSFLIVRDQNVIKLQGVNNIANFMAAGYFLDHFCGVRFYLPGDLFTSLPSTNHVEIEKTINIKEVPATTYLLSTGYHTKDEYYWAYINGFYRKNWGSHQHTMGDRFFNDTIMKNFSEIFPIFNGKRYFPVSRVDQKWQPDFAEPKLVDAAVVSAIQYFKTHPTIDYLSFSVQDSRNYPKEGKMGAFLKKYPSTPEGQKRAYTDAYIQFLNNLAERLKTELPKNGITRPKTIVFISYGQVSAIPSVKLNPALLPITVYHLSESLMDSIYNEGNGGEKDYTLDSWSKVTKRIGNHDWAEGAGFIYPRIYTNLISRFVKTVKKDKMDLEYIHVEAYPNWAMDGPKYYFMSKLYWNPDINPDSLLTQFCTDMFGKAKNEMKSYFSILEDLNTSLNNNPKLNRRIGNYITQLPLNKKEMEMVRQARQKLDAAKDIAQTSEEKQRVAFFSKGFKLSEYLFDIYNSDDSITIKADSLKSYLKDTVAGNLDILNVGKDSNFVRGMNAFIDNIVKTKKKTIESKKK